MSIRIDIHVEDSGASIDEARLRRAVGQVIEQSAAAAAQISVALVDDAAIQELNRRHLDHDYATDVLSFPLSAPDQPLEGEIVVSSETARREAARFGWSPEDELLLYAVHGALHLVGYDDRSLEAAQDMRDKEREILALFGLEPRYDDVARDASPEISRN